MNRTINEKAQYCSLCTQISVLRALGYTNDEIGKAISTPDHPSGVSAKTVYNHGEALGHKDQIERLTLWASLARREKNVIVKELTAETIRKEMEETLGDSWGQIMAAVKEGDVESAKWHIEQVIGKAKGSMDMNMRGGVLHAHVSIPQSQDLIAQQDQQIAESQAMIRDIFSRAHKVIDVDRSAN